MNEELKTFKKALKFLEIGYGTEVCKEFVPGCVNCQAQIFIGYMREHISMLKDNEI